MTISTAEMEDRGHPVRRIGEVAQLLGVHPRTLRLYEEAGLVSPERPRGQRVFTDEDVQWLRCLRRLIHEKGYGLAAVRKLLDYAPCWELLECGHGTGHECPAARERRLACWQICARICDRATELCKDCWLKAVNEEPPEERRAAD
jgi:MerR family transcriptional regulator/heat shock protein HspR